MGLFRKKKADDPQIDALRTEINSMSERLDGADRANSELEARLNTLDRSNEDFEQRFEQRFEKVDGLTVHVQELAEQTELLEQAERPPPFVSTPMPPPPTEQETTAIDHDRLTELASQLEELSVTVATQYLQSPAGREQMDAVDDLNERFGEIAERVSTIDTRVTNVSFELANQLTELSRDIEAINEQRSASVEQPSASRTAAPDDHIEDQIEDQIDLALENVRVTTEKLAAEQARYEIQFREDLADLADRLRRPDDG
jgi:DNA repair exonuclease SbcCD ATPase subunit